MKTSFLQVRSPATSLADSTTCANVHHLILPHCITAAHCNAVGSNSVRVGPSRSFFSGDRRTVSERIPHPFYDTDTLSNDFMVMKLSSPITDVPPVKLKKTLSDDETTLTAIGFGATREGGFGALFLQEVDVKQISHETCNEKYEGEILKESMLCAGINGGGKDSVSSSPTVVCQDTITQAEKVH